MLKDFFEIFSALAAKYWTETMGSGLDLGFLFLSSPLRAVLASARSAFPSVHLQLLLQQANFIFFFWLLAANFFLKNNGNFESDIAANFFLNNGGNFESDLLPIFF